MEKIERLFGKERIDEAMNRDPMLKMNDLVYQLLQEAILSSQLEPGERIHISAIAKEMNISITPVRNAVKRLADEGFVVEDAAGKAYSVFNISDQMLAQIYDARKMFEGMAAYICAQRHAVINLQALHYMAEEFRRLWLASMEKGLPSESRSQRAAIDSEFHNLLIHSTENQYIIEYYEALKNVQDHLLVRATDFWDKDPDADSKRILAGQHLSIYHAIAQGQPQVARSLAEEHIEFCKYRSLLSRLYAKK